LNGKNSEGQDEEPFFQLTAHCRPAVLASPEEEVMRHRYGLLFLVMVVAAAGCKSGACVDLKELTYKITRDGDMEAGKAGGATLSVTNRSDRYMLVERIGGAGIAPGSARTFTKSMYGALSKSKDGKSYHHDQLAQQQTPPLFAHGLIPPGQRAGFPLTLLPVEARGELVVHYRALTPLQAAQQFFLLPLAAHNGQAVFEKTASAHWEAPDTGKGEERHPRYDVVLVDGDAAWKESECTVDLPYGFKLKSAPVPVVKLAPHVGEGADWALYSETLKGWIAKVGDGVILFDGQDVSRLPDAPPTFFLDLDAKSGGGKLSLKVGEIGNPMTNQPPQPEPERAFLNDLGDLACGDGMYTTGAFIDIEPSTAPEALKRLKLHKCALVKVNFFMESYFFEVVCP